MGALLIARDLSVLDDTVEVADGETIVFGDLSADVVDIGGELMVILGSLHAIAIAMSFGGSGIGELWVAGNVTVGVIDSDESICVFGSLHADVVWGRHNDGSMHIGGDLVTEVLVGFDHVISATTEKIACCWDRNRDRFEATQIQDRLVSDTFSIWNEVPELNWRSVVLTGKRIVRS
jgi:hypothetical protein